jgi:hypothetical protein
MQDGATPHTANTILDFLHDTLRPSVISHRYHTCHGRGHKWPPNSPDINPCDFFLWGYLMEKLFPKKTSLNNVTHGFDCSNVWWNYTKYVLLSDHEHSHSHFRSCITDQWSWWACNSSRIIIHELYLLFIDI